ncbi:MAG: monovalent cation/H(+) antiporter subunit G [Clostridiales bacterium]|nr:monovalent cation/H(+) antiporter subunit G [Clostridiales bacterium]
MIGEWIRFGLSAICILAGLFSLVVSLMGLFLFDFALNRIHAAAVADTQALFLFLVGIMIAIGFHMVALKLALILFLQWCTSPLSSHMLTQFEYRVDRNLSAHCELPTETAEAAEAQEKELVES